MTGAARFRIFLRTVAVAIAVAALIDPALSVSRPAPRTVVLVQMASSGTASAESAVRATLPGVEITLRPVTDGRLPCAPGEACVMVADGSVDAEIPGDLTAPVSLIRVAVPAGPNLAVQSVAASLMQQSAGAGTLRVSMSGTGLQGRRTDLRVTDGAATVGSASHEWKADGDAAVDLPWWPLGEGPRTLRVTAVPFDGETSLADNGVEVGVDVSSARVSVLVFDTRPSWASTFVRRALEDDRRFQVAHFVALGPALVAGTARGRLDARALDAVPVAIVGSPDALSGSDVTLLERFVRERGGTLILVPDRALSGPSMRLLAGRWTEHLEASASAVGPLRASETLRMSSTSPFDVVLGAVAGSPAIVLTPSGHGRIVVSGAMDAWRYRDTDGGAFEQFWRSLVLESASAGAALQLDFARPLAVPGASVPFTVRHRQMESGVQRAVRATASCGGPAQSIRLWPQGASGVFGGTLVIDGTEPCEVSAAVDGGPVVTGGVAVTTGATASVSAVLGKLERAAGLSGGATGTVGEVTAVVSALATVVPESPPPVPVHPMRSVWWMSPFVACLGAEWWLRRRAGLR